MRVTSTFTVSSTTVALAHEEFKRTLMPPAFEVKTTFPVAGSDGKVTFELTTSKVEVCAYGLPVSSLHAVRVKAANAIPHDNNIFLISYFYNLPFVFMTTREGWQ